MTLLPLALFFLAFPSMTQSFVVATSQPSSPFSLGAATQNQNKDSSSSSPDKILDRSTLTLLEHVNLNVPNHDHILPLYFGLFGCGMDPRKAANLAPDDKKRTLWANCGASQFHLPFGDTAQRIPGQIGLRFESLEGLQQRLQTWKEHYATAESGKDPGSGREYIRITDHYGNVFVCRAKLSPDTTSTSTTSTHHLLRQPFIRPDETEEWGEIATKYGRVETDCQGIDYVEFHCPKGTASKIALFYESVLDATTTVVDTGSGSSIAIVAVGNVDQQGRADQSILFREITNEEESIPEYDGHHVALYVGESAEDFEQAFKNAQVANIVWCNPRFQDQVDSLEEARKEKQFRFKDIVDMETGELIMELEHELRSIQHPAWPGKTE